MQSFKADILKLLIVFLSAIASALLLTTYMVKTGPQEERYTVKKVLLAPTVLEKSASSFSLQYQEQETFWKELLLTFDQYKKLYHIMEQDVSLKEVNKEIIYLFNKNRNTALTIRAKTSSGKEIVQVVEFSPDTMYYRVGLLAEGEGFAYFRHPNVLLEVLGAIRS